MISEIIRTNVRQNQNGSVMGHRIGTAIASTPDLTSILGEPHEFNPDGEKVTTIWKFETPRGSVEIRDYWWNRENEWSIVSSEFRAVRWLMAWLRRQNVKCFFGDYYDN